MNKKEIKSDNIHIRQSIDSDIEDVLRIEREAFGEEDEALLVSKLLSGEAPSLSLLAFRNGEAVGHILFTEATIDKKSSPGASILAPLAVLPSYQRQGIGGMLIQEGFRRLKISGVKLVFVLGHEDYYPQYGFMPDAGALGFEAPYTIPHKNRNSWMVCQLGEGPYDKGKVVCAEVLDREEYWIE